MDTTESRLVREEGQVKPFDGDPAEVFDALADEACRRLLVATATPRTATELRDELSLPSSTLYRKLNRLLDAGLIREVEQTPTGGNPAHRYQRTVASIDVALSARELPKLWVRYE
ncbi:MAG: helix-turn-helix domain-containing protein [Haloarculaceae archaeon]